MALREFAPELAEALDVAATRADLQVALTNQENTEIVQSMSGAFGYAPRAQLESERSRLRILRFNGVEPTTSMLAAGRYPLALSFSLVIRPDPADEAIPFVEFVFSATGRTIIERSGNLAVTGWPPAP